MAEKKGEQTSIESFRKQVPGFYRDLREMKTANVLFLAGTDVGVAFMYPGFSLHDELQSLVRNVGFSPMEVLRVATYNPQLFLGERRARGAIAPGERADLVLLAANPLEDIGNHGAWMV